MSHTSIFAAYLFYAESDFSPHTHTRTHTHTHTHTHTNTTQEKAATEATSVKSLHELGAYLGKEKFERQADVQSREKAIKEGLDSLEAQGKEKKPVLEDDLARELCKEKVTMWVKLHKDIYDKLVSWSTEKQQYLSAIHTTRVSSVQDANLQVSLLEAFTHEKADTVAGEGARLTQQGNDIRNEKYKSAYSEWHYEKPEVSFFFNVWGLSPPPFLFFLEILG